MWGCTPLEQMVYSLLRYYMTIRVQQSPGVYALHELRNFCRRITSSGKNGDGFSEIEIFGACMAPNSQSSFFFFQVLQASN